MNAMTCREFDEAVHGFVRMELLDVVVRELVLDHAAHCSNCADRMGEAKLLAEMSESVAASSRSEEAPPHVEAAILSAFRAHHRRASWQKRLEWITAGAIAAVVLLLTWGYARHDREPVVPAHKKDTTSESSRPIDASIPPASQPAAARGPAAAAGTVPDNAAEGESALLGGAPATTSDFVPIPFTDGMNPDDSGMVVRVQLTRDSLAELGYPVAETPDEGLIRADVLVGEDGWPRGVRLAQ
jgi:hypothetical protein